VQTNAYEWPRGVNRFGSRSYASNLISRSQRVSVKRRTLRSWAYRHL